MLMEEKDFFFILKKWHKSFLALKIWKYKKFSGLRLKKSNLGEVRVKKMFNDCEPWQKVKVFKKVSKNKTEIFLSFKQKTK